MDPMDVDEDPIDLRQWARAQFGDAFLNEGGATDNDILSLLAFSHKRWTQARFRFLCDHQRGDPTFGSDAIPGISKAALDIRESANSMIHQGNMVDDLINMRILQPTYTHQYRNEPMPSENEYTRIRSTLFGISYRLTVEEAWVIASIALRPDERIHHTITTYIRDIAIPFIDDVSTYMLTLKDMSYQMRMKNDFTYETEYATNVYPAWDIYNDALVECISASQRLAREPRKTPGEGQDWGDLSRRTVQPLIFHRAAVVEAIRSTRRYSEVMKKLKAKEFPFNWSNKTIRTHNSLIPTLQQLPDLPVQRVTPWQKNDLAFGLTELGAHTLKAAAEARGGPPLGTLGPELGDAGGPVGRSYANGVGDGGPADAWDYYSSTLKRKIKGIYYLTPIDRNKRKKNVEKSRKDRADAAQGGGGGNITGPAATLGNGFAGAAGNDGGNDGGNRGGRGGRGQQRPDGRGGNRGNHRGNAAANANQNGGRGRGGRPRNNDDNDGGRNTRRRNNNNTWGNMAQVANAVRTRAARVADIAMDPAYAYSSYGRRATAPAAAEKGSGISWEELERRELAAQGIVYDDGYDYGYDEEYYEEEDYEEEEDEEDDEEDDMAQFVRLHGKPRGITRTAAAEDSLLYRKRLAEEIGLVSSLGKRRRI